MCVVFIYIPKYFCFIFRTTPQNYKKFLDCANFMRIKCENPLFLQQKGHGTGGYTEVPLNEHCMIVMDSRGQKQGKNEEEIFGKQFSGHQKERNCGGGKEGGCADIIRAKRQRQCCAGEKGQMDSDYQEPASPVLCGRWESILTAI